MSYDNRDYYRPSGFGRFSFFPPVIKWLLIINAVVFFLQTITSNLMISGYPAEELFRYYFALMPLGQGFKIWQLISYQFMHAGFMHIFFNMFMLWMFGMEIENLMGVKKFLIFYLFCGVMAGLFQLLIPPMMGSMVGATIGASGAVFGVMVAFAMYFPDRYIYIYFLLPVKAKYLIAFLVVFEFLSVGQMSIVAHLAHIGGAVTGLLFVLLDRKYNFNFNKLFSGSGGSSTFKQPNNFNFRSTFKKRKVSDKDIQDAEFYDINESNKNDPIPQSEIDKILDKISSGGYQNLTEREKRILFEASKRNIHEK